MSYPANKWIREEVKGLKTYDAPQMSSGCKVKQSGSGKLVKNHIGYFLNGSNSVYDNNQQVALFSGAYSNGHGLSVIPSNFRKICSLFTARKTIKRDWINDKDEYMKPKGGK